MSANDAWAVGWSAQQERGPRQALIEHWDGQKWSIVPSAAARGGSLYGLAAFAANDVWAVGEHGNVIGGSPGLIEHWDGKQWSAVPNPGIGLVSVSGGASNDVWAVGAVHSYSHTSVIHWNGRAWRSFGPSVGNAVSARTTRDVWAVGPSSKGAEHWNGRRWTVYKTPTGPHGREMEAVVVLSPSDAWAGGDVLEHWDGRSWKTVSTRIGANGMTAASAKDVWAVEYDTAFHYAC